MAFDTSVTYRRSASFRSSLVMRDAFKYSRPGNRAMEVDRTSPWPRFAVKGMFLNRSDFNVAMELMASRSIHVDAAIPLIWRDMRLGKSGLAPAPDGIDGMGLSSMLRVSRSGNVENLLTWFSHASKPQLEQSSSLRFWNPWMESESRMSNRFEFAMQRDSRFGIVSATLSIVLKLCTIQLLRLSTFMLSNFTPVIEPTSKSRT
mmetsp:Transcript_20310/g.50519  ORF Transcript_20310/g.50519 Transcript_20310/m.50519 type:complete len:204 (+) Transcript_20310:557-1168(+)